MSAYILRRVLLMIPTLIGVLTITFLVTEFVPGGPADQIRAMLEGRAGAGGTEAAAGGGSRQGKERFDPKQEQRLRRLYNLHLSRGERYLRTLLWYSRDSILSSQEIDRGETVKFRHRDRPAILLRREADRYTAFFNSWGREGDPGEIVFDGAGGTWKSVLDGTRFDPVTGQAVEAPGTPGLEPIPLTVRPGTWRYEIRWGGRLYDLRGEEMEPGEPARRVTVGGRDLWLLRAEEGYFAAPAQWVQDGLRIAVHYDAEAGHWMAENGLRFDRADGRPLDDPLALGLDRVRVRRVKRDSVYVAESAWAALGNSGNWHGFFLFRFGKSIYRNQTVIGLIGERLPVSASLGFWSFLITYPTCIFLGIAKAVRNGTRFDAATSAAILLGYSIPGFVLAVLLIVFFGPGEASLLNLFPLSGLTSVGTEGYEAWSAGHKILDYFHHLAAPILCLSVGGFAVLTMLTKNSLLEETHKLYAVAARARGLSERQVLYKHILRNAMIPLVTTFPSTFLFLFLTGSLLIERIFSIDGLGLLSYASVMDRDFPVIMGSLFIFTLIKLIGQLLTDICYVVVDPRISFEGGRG